MADLTDEQRAAMNEAYLGWFDKQLRNLDKPTSPTEAFHSGFAAGLAYQQAPGAAAPVERGDLIRRLRLIADPEERGYACNKAMEPVLAIADELAEQPEQAVPQTEQERAIPREPTTEMINAAIGTCLSSSATPLDVWRAMYDAVPQAPEPLLTEAGSDGMRALTTAGDAMMSRALMRSAKRKDAAIPQEPQLVERRETRAEKALALLTTKPGDRRDFHQWVNELVQTVREQAAEITRLTHEVERQLDVDSAYLKKLVLDERERCARICEEVRDSYPRPGDSVDQFRRFGATDCAAAIRKQG